MITETCLCPVHPSAMLFLVLATAVKAKRRLELALGVLHQRADRPPCFLFLEDVTPPSPAEGVITEACGTF
jgi:hypothetical protein